MNPTEHTASPASTPKIGLLTMLRDLLHIKGTSATKTSKGTGATKTSKGTSATKTSKGTGTSKITRGTGAPSARRLTLSVLATTLAALAFTPAPALAAAPEKPITISPAGSITGTSAVFNGTLDPHSKALVGGYFAYSAPEGLTCAEGPIVALEGFEGEKAEEAIAVHALVGLEPSRTYKFCLVATNEAGVGVTPGEEVSVTTPAIAPKVEFETAYPKQTEATLEADVNADNQEVTNCEFQYGTDATLAASTSVECEPKTLPGLYGPQGVTVAVPGLQADQTYYYRVVAENKAGEKEAGAVEHFTTTPETPEALEPEPIAGTTATLKGLLNPEATLPGSPGNYEFVYWRSASECEFINNVTERVEYEKTPVTGSLGDAREPVSAPVTGLLPDSQYTVCLLARNAAGEASALSAPVTFATPIVAPIVEGESSSEVSANEARLRAKLNPGGLETSYRFEYGPAVGSYDASVPATPREIPAGANSVSVNAVATGLQPGMAYHYRIVASNAQSPAGGTPGPDQTFTTLAAVGNGSPPTCSNEQARTEQPYGQALPDCRAYEMVSPLEKDDNDILVTGARASTSGEAFTFISLGSFADPRGANPTSRYLARRGAGGWSTQNITPPRRLVERTSVTPFGSMLFTPSLSAGLVSSEDVPLAGEEPGFFNLDVADLASSPVSYQQISVNEPGIKPYEEPSPIDRPAGASSDLSHVVFQATANLTPGATGGYQHVYEWAGGKLSQVDIPPAGTQFEERIGNVGAPGNENRPILGDTWHAVSGDGRRVFFTDGDSYSEAPGQLYVRENPEQPQGPEVNGKCTVSGDACTVEVSASQRTDCADHSPCSKTPEPDPNGPQRAWFRDASVDGSRVFFTSRAELTNDADTGPEDDTANLYEYNLETGILSDLTAENGEGADVLGLVTASENAGEENSYVYFVANGVLASNENTNNETARPGNCKKEEYEVLTGEHTCSLYVAHYNDGTWTTTFVATLSSGENTKGIDEQLVFGDEGDWVGHEGDSPAQELLVHDAGPGQHTVRVTADGTTLAFQSERQLTSYDNTVAGGVSCGGYAATSVARGPACPEVYLYNAVTEKLVCASCDPSGAPPVGSADLGPEKSQQNKSEEVSQFEGLEANTEPFYLPRNLSEDGRRLFFESPDALVPHDSNGLRDVYEWEAAGEGSCAQAEGCVYAISDVAGDSGSKFMDASPDGDDVFINTADQLLPSDTDSRTDVYDVKAGGGFPVTVPAPVCDNGDSCKPPVSPQPAIFGAPSSATFSGPGNAAPAVAPPPPKVVPKKAVKCGKNFVKKKLKKKETCVRKKKSKKAKKSAKGRK